MTVFTLQVIRDALFIVSMVSSGVSSLMPPTMVLLMLMRVLMRMLMRVLVGCTDGYRGSYDYPWKSTKMRMTIHFHMNRNFVHDGYPYDLLGYYDGLDDVPSCLYDVLDDVPWHWLIDP